ncbi:MAG: TetR/AcrR family transcriptional regulator [Solirubrobacteraceae bacterium]|nr:TetR/AcrR family transcriptional regulator [Solirubrobacteraceae bacterium]
MEVMFSVPHLYDPDVATSPAPRGLRADAERNRQRLLDAAAELFAERGLDVSLQEIAAHAGVGVATAYRRFPDRAALVDELFDQRLGQVIAIAQEGLEHDDPWVAFVQVMEGILERMSGNLGLKQLMMGEVRAGERQARLRAQLLPVMSQVIRRAQEAGEVRPDLEPTDMPIFNVMITAGMHLTQPTHPDHWRRMLVIMLDGIRVRRDEPSPLPAPALAVEDLPRVMGTLRPG